MMVSEDHEKASYHQENTSIVFILEKVLPYGDLKDSTPHQLRNGMDETLNHENDRGSNLIELES